MTKEFPKNIHEKIKSYVYLYVDPRNDEIFYVGKGKDNRAFSHLSDNSESNKVKRISDIRKDGYEPIIEILIHGLDDDMVKRIEASIIDLLSIENLTNIQKGYGAKDYGRMSIEQLVAMYQSDEVEISEPSILININKSFHYGMSSIELYDATRSAWVVGVNRVNAIYAFAIYEGIVQQVYEIKGWFPNNSTFNTLKDRDSDQNEERWEFVGRIAEEKIISRYRYKNVSKYMGPRNPINYVNI